jgi:SAM-dependent methyltransferase
MHPAETFKALADETRIRILNLLRDQELSVNEIAGILEMGQSRISRHLKILTDRGFLACRRDGLWAFYTVPPKGDGRRLLDAFGFLLKNQPDLRSDRGRARKIMDERSAVSARFFNSLAGDWDRIKREILGPLDIYREIEEWIPSGGVVADLGCGTGGLLLSIGEKVRRAIGVDNSPKMLEQARRRFVGQSERIEIRMGELEHLPLRDQEVDAVVINMVLHHLPSPLEGFAEANRALKPGGTLVVTDFIKHSREQMRSRFGDRWLGFRPDELTAWFHEAGFSVKNTKRLPVKGGLELQIYCSQKHHDGGGR